jgi:hypothetical protein
MEIVEPPLDPLMGEKPPASLVGALLSPLLTTIDASGNGVLLRI